MVVGLNGTGDDLTDITFTKESLIAMLERLGVNTRDNKVDPDNVAAVMVTSTLPPFVITSYSIHYTKLYDAGYIALSRQTALWRQMDQIANNMANVNTAGFKGEQMLFTDYVAAVRTDRSLRNNFV